MTSPAPSSAGSSVPVKFSLGANYGFAILAAGYPQSTQIDCTTLAPLGSPSPTQANGGGLQFADGTYSYIWKTEKSWAGTCREINVKLTDGTSHTADFSFR
jgi:hypothetical protein